MNRVTTMRAAALLLDRGALLIERRGWSQGRGYGADGSVCALVALLYRHAVGPEAYFPHERLAIAALREFVGCFIPDWNDAPGRTAEEVTSAMRAVAATLRAQASSMFIDATTKIFDDLVSSLDQAVVAVKLFGESYEAADTHHEQGVQVHTVYAHGPGGDVQEGQEGAGGRGSGEGGSRPGRAGGQGARDRPKEVVYS